MDRCRWWCSIRNIW